MEVDLVPTLAAYYAAARASAEQCQRVSLAMQERRLAQLNRRLDRSAAHGREVEERAASLSRELESARGVAEAREKEIDLLRQRRQEGVGADRAHGEVLRAQCDSYRRELAELREDVKLRDEELRDVRELFKEREREAEMHREAARTKDRDVRDVRDQLRSRDAEVRRKEGQIEKSAAAKQQLEGQVRDLQDELTELRQKLATSEARRSISSSAPVVSKPAAKRARPALSPATTPVSRHQAQPSEDEDEDEEEAADESMQEAARPRKRQAVPAAVPVKKATTTLAKKIVDEEANTDYSSPPSSRPVKPRTAAPTSKVPKSPATKNGGRRKDDVDEGEEDGSSEDERVSNKENRRAGKDKLTGSKAAAAKKAKELTAKAKAKAVTMALSIEQPDLSPMKPAAKKPAAAAAAAANKAAKKSIATDAGFSMTPFLNRQAATSVDLAAVPLSPPSFGTTASADTEAGSTAAAAGGAAGGVVKKKRKLFGGKTLMDDSPAKPSSSSTSAAGAGLGRRALGKSKLDPLARTILGDTNFGRELSPLKRPVSKGFVL